MVKIVQKSKMRAILVTACFPASTKKEAKKVLSQDMTESCRLTLKLITKDQYNDVALTFGSRIDTTLLPWGLLKKCK